MKLLLVFTLCIIGCLCKVLDLPFQTEFEASFNAWKRLDPPSYTYTSSFHSWVGYGQSTEVKVSQHSVVQRKFESWEDYLTTTSTTKTIDSWNENTPELIGSHPAGFPAETMEQVYKRCLNEILTKNITENDIFFAVDNAGILKQCQYYPHFCNDDCMFGIILDEVVYASFEL